MDDEPKYIDAGIEGAAHFQKGILLLWVWWNYFFFLENPKCKNVGCGKWSPKQIKNPKYKGKWSPNQIKNTKYQGEYKYRQIQNPDYFEDENPVKNLKPMVIFFFHLFFYFLLILAIREHLE